MTSKTTRLKPGTIIPTQVAQPHIDNSDPCNKDNCMLSRAIFAHLVSVYGDRNFRIKSTNHGVIFDLAGRRYTGLFDTKTAQKIYAYDEIFKTTHNKAKARAAIRPFKARLIIEKSMAVPVPPPMSAEDKVRIRKYPHNNNQAHRAKKTGSRRELSL